MITKRDFLITVMVIIMLSIFLGVMLNEIWRESRSSPPPSFLSAAANQSLNKVSEWKMGDEIVPFPYIDGKRLDCDDAVLYSYLYLEDIPGLQVRIMYGVLSMYENEGWIRRAHTWLEVSDNETTLIYDYGIPLPNDYFKGRKISYAQLLMYAHADY